jgi:hypothetical protein
METAHRFVLFSGYPCVPGEVGNQAIGEVQYITGLQPDVADVPAVFMAAPNMPLE